MTASLGVPTAGVLILLRAECVVVRPIVRQTPRLQSRFDLRALKPTFVRSLFALSAPAARLRLIAASMSAYGRPGTKRKRTTRVLPGRHDLEMRGIAASLVTAAVVKLTTRRHRPDKELVGSAMRQAREPIAIRRRCRPPSDVAVAPGSQPARPLPTDSRTEFGKRSQAGRELRKASRWALTGHTPTYPESTHSAMPSGVDMDDFRALLTRYREDA